MSDKIQLKSLPAQLTDEEAEKFAASADLTDYDLSGFTPMKFEFRKKTARLELRLPAEQLAEIKRVAKMQGIPYTRLVRQFIEQGINALEDA